MRNSVSYPVLNWRSPDPRLARSLVKKFDARKMATGKAPDFVVIRLGAKWAHRLKPGQRVAIAITPTPGPKKVVGHACVMSVTKRWFITIEERELRKNIGAKGLEQCLLEMESVHGKGGVKNHSVVSIIELVPVE